MQPSAYGILRADPETGDNPQEGFGRRYGAPESDVTGMRWGTAVYASICDVSPDRPPSRLAEWGAHGGSGRGDYPECGIARALVLVDADDGDGGHRPPGWVRHLHDCHRVPVVVTE